MGQTSYGESQANLKRQSEVQHVRGFWRKLARVILNKSLLQENKSLRFGTVSHWLHGLGAVTGREETSLFSLKREDKILM